MTTMSQCCSKPGAPGAAKEAVRSLLQHPNPQATTPQHLPVPPDGHSTQTPTCQQGRPRPADPGVTAPGTQNQDVTPHEDTGMRPVVSAPAPCLPAILQGPTGAGTSPKRGGEHRAPAVQLGEVQLLQAQKSNVEGVPAGQHAPPGANGAELCQTRSCPRSLPHALAPSTGLERVLQSPANPFKEASHGAKFVCKGSS